MITKIEIEEAIDSLKVRPVNHTIIISVPVVSETTETGIIKGDALMAEEDHTKDAFMTVLAVAEDVTVCKPGDRVFLQGNITTFAKDTTPPELNVAPHGYQIGLTFDSYVKMVI